MVDYSSLLAAISYDPLSWIDRSYLDPCCVTFCGKRRALINEILIDSCRFKPLLMETLSRFDKEIIRFWFSLVNIFTLMAYFRYKAFLPSTNKRLLSDKAVRFALLVPANGTTSTVFKFDLSTNLTESLLQLQAYREMSAFADYFSDSVLRRLQFLFPSSLKQTLTNDPVQDADFLLLRIACNYYVKSKK